MHRLRLVAATLVVITLVAVSFAALSLDEADRPQVALASPMTTTTDQPDYSALVESGVSPVLPEAEVRLTEEAVSRATSTTTSTSTTIAETTTSPPTTAPPTTAPPETTAPSKSTGQTPKTTTTTAAPPSTVSTGFVAAAEGDFASRINALRGSDGLAALSRDGSLDSYARTWAERLAKDGGLSHSNIGSLLPPWSAAGENVGVGGSVGGIFDALAASSGHRANMLGDFTHIGVGVYRDSQGVLWTAHVFTR